MKAIGLTPKIPAKQSRAAKEKSELDARRERVQKAVILDSEVQSYLDTHAQIHVGDWCDPSATEESVQLFRSLKGRASLVFSDPPWDIQTKSKDSYQSLGESDWIDNESRDHFLTRALDLLMPGGMGLIITLFKEVPVWMDIIKKHTARASMVNDPMVLLGQHGDVFRGRITGGTMWSQSVLYGVAFIRKDVDGFEPAFRVFDPNQWRNKVFRGPSNSFILPRNVSKANKLVYGKVRIIHMQTNKCVNKCFFCCYS